MGRDRLDQTGFWQTLAMVPNLGDEKNEPSLELPTLKLPGLGRRARRKAGPSEPVAEAAEAPSEEAAPGDTPVEPPVEQPVEQPALARGAHSVEDAAEPTVPLSAPATRSRRAGRASRTSRTAEPAGPVLPGRLAAVLTGLLVGVAGAAGTYGAMEGCEEVRGVSTCGGAPGFFILVAIVALMVLLGSVILKALRVADTTSTSFLAVGIVTVVVMLTLLDQVFSPWMFVVIPLLSAAAYALAHWVTTRFEHEDTGRRDWT